MNPRLAELLQFFWSDYSSITPSAPRIHALLAARGEKVVNDHIAFRTYNLEPIRLESLAEVFEALGYRPTGDYHFAEKKLRARSFGHPDPDTPKVFISELLTEQFSPWLQETAVGLARQVPAARAGTLDLFLKLPSWAPVPFDTYQRLIDESEYAGWVAAYGIRVNHFTVLFNALKSFDSLGAFNDWLVANGFKLNESGGTIKGTPQELLEQSSILASRVETTFAGGERRVVPSCYYEFARRYTDPATGAPYAGFIAKSADKIFESTDTKLEP